jgi:hypothetical protein
VLRRRAGGPLHSHPVPADGRQDGAGGGHVHGHHHAGGGAGAARRWQGGVAGKHAAAAGVSTRCPLQSCVVSMLRLPWQWVLKLLPWVQVYALEIEQYMKDFAQPVFEQAGVDHKVTLHPCCCWLPSR